MQNRSVDYVKESQVFWLMMSNEEKVEYYIDLVRDGKADKQAIEHLLRHNKKMLSLFRKHTKGIR